MLLRCNSQWHSSVRIWEWHHHQYNVLLGTISSESFSFIQHVRSFLPRIHRRISGIYSRISVLFFPFERFPVRVTMSIKTCGVCEGPIELPDGHDSCVFCLGHAHAEAAVIESNCPHCGEMSVRALRTRIAILLNEQPILSSQQSPSTSYAEPWKTKSHRPEVETGRATGEHMSVHPPRASRSPFITL